MNEKQKPAILVLGGYGFIGRHLVGQLVRLGYPVTVFGHPSHEPFAADPAGLLDFRFGDFGNARELETAIVGAEVVFHLIGNTVPQSSNDNPRFDVDAHVGPTLTLLDLCVKHAVRQVVFTSSGGTVYGIPAKLPIDEQHTTLPISSYGIQKITIEHYLRLYQRLHGLNATVLRVANPYGPGQNIGRNQGLISMICNKIKQGQNLEIWGDGSIVRDYIYIDDLVDAMERTIAEPAGFNIYNLGTGIGTSINQIVDAFRQLGVADLKVEYKPARQVDIPVNILDCRKFAAQFGWSVATGLAAGIRATLAASQEAS